MVKTSSPVSQPLHERGPDSEQVTHVHSEKFMSVPSGGASVPLVIVLRGGDAVRLTAHTQASAKDNPSASLQTNKSSKESTCMHAR